MEDERLQRILTNVNQEDEDRYELGEEHLPFLFRVLHILAERWDSFCLQLGVNDIDQIHRRGTAPDDCLVLGLQSWLRGEAVSWKRLIEAIYLPAGGGHQRLASEVAESFRVMCCFIPIEQARSTSTARICCPSEVESAVANIQKKLAAKVAPRWYQMGVILGAQVSDLEAIRLAGLSATKSEQKVLQAWLSNCENPTWQRLVDAVGHRAGGNHQRLAKSLSKELDKNDAGGTGAAGGPSCQSPSSGTTSQSRTDVQTDFKKTIKRGDRVDMVALQRFSTPSQTINILQRVGTNYKPMLGNILLRSHNGGRVRSCEMTHRSDVDQVVYDIFQKWCAEDDTCTWGQLVLHLRAANLSLANDIDSVLI